MGGAIIIVIFLLVYFLPAMVASSRDHQQKLAIFMLNLLLGWTAIGWILAIVWACTALQKRAIV